MYYTRNGCTNLLFWRFLSETCMKSKEILDREGVTPRVTSAPLDSLMVVIGSWIQILYKMLNLEKIVGIIDDPFDNILGYSDFTFLATFDTISPAVTQPIIFNNAVVNPGGHYDNETGIYTVPIDGTYELIINLASSADVQYRAHLNVDGTPVCITSLHYYGPQQSCGKVIFSQACINKSVHREGPASVHAGVHTRLGRPLVQTSPGQKPPRQTSPTPLDRHPLPPPPSRRLLQRTVRIPLECILVLKKSSVVFQKIRSIDNCLHMRNCKIFICHTKM